MKRKKLIFYICIILLLAGGTLAAKSQQTRRYSIIIGANQGGPGRVKLKYAVSDARSLQRVLKRMGGINTKDNILLVEPNRRSFFNALSRIDRRIRNEGKKYRRTELIFYYSGHSDEEGILLKKQKVSYREIKKNIRSIPVDVHIAILDSCSSGAFTRLKGGKMRSPFLIDTSFDMKGYAFMTSSSDHEASQESDRIGGSFFTHYLVSGLRGAADTTGDGRVTLNEAYQYAYAETLARTEKTLSGPQHPHYNIRMTGKGDVIMTDIRKSAAGLNLAKNIYGRIAIRDRYNRLVAEINKPAGRTVQIGLDAGRYTVINERNGKLYETSLYIRGGSQGTITSRRMKITSREKTYARGDKDLSDYQTMWFSFQFLPSFGSGLKIIHNFAFSFFGSYSTRLQGLALSLGVDIVGEDSQGVQAALIANITAADARYVQAAGIFSIAGGNMTGVQMSGIFNSAGSTMDGIQASGIFNTVGDSVSGAQLAGIFNFTDDNVRGFQIAGIFNYAKNITGLQAGLVNINTDNTKGLQLGLVNITNNLDGASIGLVNIVLNGITRFDLYEEETGFTKFAVKHGSEHFYTLYALGFDYQKNMSLGIGFGTYLPAGKFFFDIDLAAHSIYSLDNFENSTLHSQLRASVGYRILKSLSIFIGASYNYQYQFKNPAVQASPLYGYASSNGNHQHWPGVHLGVQM